ncbi:MAG: Zn-ribbon domain-containing OB-fold protein [Candidatus Hodarchaeales archaeon]|jgi:uncharacterized OB-fold protein
MRFGYASDKLVETPFIDEFAQKLTEDKFQGTKCQDCGKIHFPPRKACQCLSTNMEWLDLPREATLEGFSFIGEMGMPPEALQNRVPYFIAVGKLKGEGMPAFAAHMTGVVRPKIGMDLKVIPNQELDGGDRVVFKFVKA